MSISDTLLCSLRKRMNCMVAETVQHCMCGDKIIDEKIIESDKLLLIILREISKGDIKSVWFTRDQAKHSLQLYEYLHDCKINGYSAPNTCHYASNDYEGTTF